jgi:hypothetical protein
VDAMTGQIAFPSTSSNSAVGSHDKAPCATLSPPLILPSIVTNNLTEKQGKKTNPNPISPADDVEDSKFTDGVQLIQEDELVLKDTTRAVLNVSGNHEVGTSKAEVNIMEERKPNLISDGQQVVSYNQKYRTRIWGNHFKH